MEKVNSKEWIRPCAYCGSKDISLHRMFFSKKYLVSCDNEECEAMGGEFKYKRGAVRTWNKVNRIEKEKK